MNDTHYVNSYVNGKILKVNVGFLISEGVGRSRDNEFDVPLPLRVSDDLTLDYLKGPLRFSRTSRGVLVQGTLATQLHTDCARCLDEAVVRPNRTPNSWSPKMATSIWRRCSVKK